jgi:serine/threonine protein kinase
MREPSDEFGRRTPGPGEGPPPSGSGRRATLGLPAFAAAELAEAPAAGLPSGTILGKYQIVRQLGEGGMGAVYEALHTGINKPVALKTMNPGLAADPRFSARFSREAAAASRLDHPHVVGVTDFGTDAGVSYIVMELLRGEDLASLIAREGPQLDPALVADIMLAVCAGVFAAHEAGVVHRDLKPQNVFVARTPLGELVPKVLDFGISKILDKEGVNGLTTTGGVVGTMHYMSPEQVTGKNVDGRSDQYALGVILYECLTGRRPHEGDTIFVVMRSIGEGGFEPPSVWRPDLPPELEQIILRAMALRLQDRFESVHALGSALLRFASPRGRVLWSDYYERERPPVSAASGGLGGGAYPPVRATRPLDLAHEDDLASMSRTGAAAPSFAGAGGGRSGGRGVVDSRSGVAPVAVPRTQETLRRSSRRWGPLAVVLGVAGAGAVAWLLLAAPPPGPSVEPPSATSGGPSVRSTREAAKDESAAPAGGSARDEAARLRSAEEEAQPERAGGARPGHGAGREAADEGAARANGASGRAEVGTPAPRTDGNKKRHHDARKGHAGSAPAPAQPRVIYNPAGAPILE